MQLGELARRSLAVGPLAVASAASLANSLVIAVVYARVAGAAAFGIYQLALAAASVASVASLSGSATAATRAAAQGRNAVWGLFRMRLPFCVGAGTALAVVAFALAVADETAIAAALGVAGLTVPGFLGGDVYQAQLLGERRYREYLRFQLGIQTLTAVGVVGAVVAAPSQPWIAVLALTGITGTFHLAGTVRSPRAPAHPEDVRFARRMTGVSLAGALEARLDVILAGALLGTREAGLVGVARIAPAALKTAWMALLYQPLFAAMARGTLAEAREMARRYRSRLALGSAAFCGLLAIAVPSIFPAIFGESFSEATLVAQLLLIATPLYVLGALDVTFLRAHAFARGEAFLHFVLAGLSVTALPPLIVVFGIEGVGIEALLSGVVYVALARRLALRRAAKEGAAS